MSIYTDPISEALGIRPIQEYFPDFDLNPAVPEDATQNCIWFGEQNPFCGQKHTEETKSKLKGPRPNISGKNNHFYGKTHSKETKEKISAAHKGRKWPDEINAKKRRPGSTNHFYGKTHSKETKEKISNNCKGVCPAKVVATGESLGKVSISDPRWASKEIAHPKSKIFKS